MKTYRMLTAMSNDPAECIRALDEEVNYYINKLGFVPVGGVSVSHVLVNNRLHYMAAQAVIKES